MRIIIKTQRTKEMQTVWIFAVISAILGLGCISYNQENNVKHNILLGFVGYTLAVLVPVAIIGGFYF